MAMIILIVFAQAITTVVRWVQLNSNVQYAASLAASDLVLGRSFALAQGDKALANFGISDADGKAVAWTISANTVSLTVTEPVQLNLATDYLHATAQASIN